VIPALSQARQGLKIILRIGTPEDARVLYRQRRWSAPSPQPLTIRREALALLAPGPSFVSSYQTDNESPDAPVTIRMAAERTKMVLPPLCAEA